MLIIQLKNEKLAYLSLLHIMVENNWRALYISGMERLLVMIEKLNERLELEVPEVYTHFKTHQVFSI